MPNPSRSPRIRQDRKNGGTGPPKAVPLGAEIGALEARAEMLMKSAATLQFEAMRLVAKAAELGRVRDGGTG